MSRHQLDWRQEGSVWRARTAFRRVAYKIICGAAYELYRMTPTGLGLYRHEHMAAAQNLEEAMKIAQNDYSRARGLVACPS